MNSRKEKNILFFGETFELFNENKRNLLSF